MSIPPLILEGKLPPPLAAIAISPGEILIL